jgi:hypothetical protein
MRPGGGLGLLPVNEHFDDSALSSPFIKKTMLVI